MDRSEWASGGYFLGPILSSVVAFHFAVQPVKRPVDTAALWTGKPTPAATAAHRPWISLSPRGFLRAYPQCPPAPPPLPSIYITLPGEGEPAPTLSITAPRQVVNGTPAVPFTTWLPRSMRKAVTEFERGGSCATGLVWRQAGRGVECKPSSLVAWW